MSKGIIQNEYIGFRVRADQKLGLLVKYHNYTAVLRQWIDEDLYGKQSNMDDFVKTRSPIMRLLNKIRRGV